MPSDTTVESRASREARASRASRESSKSGASRKARESRASRASRDSRAPSGRFVLRIDPGVHGHLREAAHAAGASLNEYCARKLAAPGTWLDEEASSVVERAASILGEALVGVVAFGSWVRGEHDSTSDFDVLLAAADDLPVSRDLYRRWDETPGLSWQGLEVEPHFVHLLPEGEVPSGLWAEVATDGVILFERGFEVSRRLAEVRRRIADGDIVRRLAQGQPYWVRAG